MQKVIQISLTVMLSLAVAAASSLCVIEDSFHSSVSGSNDHHSQEEVTNLSKDNSPAHQDEDNDACCQDFLAYLSAPVQAPGYFPIPINNAAVFNPTSFYELLIYKKSFGFDDFRHAIFSPQRERYALSNPPKAPPLS